MSVLLAPRSPYPAPATAVWPSCGDRGQDAEMTTDEMAALAARVQRMEDELEVRRVILAYGPSADAGLTARAAAGWLDDGEYDWDATRAPLAGRAGVAAMLEGDGHQSLIANGVAHFTGPALVEI